MNLIVSHYKSSLPQRLLLLLVLGASAQLAIGQQTQSQSPTETPVHATDAQAQQQEVANISAPALMTLRYWWFLSYQHHLDVVAAQFEASGKDASNLRNALQKQLRFSDADYEPVRASSERLAAEVQSLYTEVKSDPSQMAGLSGVSKYYGFSDAGFNVRLTTTDTFTWTDSESTGVINSNGNSMNVTLETNSSGCEEDNYVYEDTRYHTLVVEPPEGVPDCQ